MKVEGRRTSDFVSAVGPISPSTFIRLAILICLLERSPGDNDMTVMMTQTEREAREKKALERRLARLKGPKQTYRLLQGFHVEDHPTERDENGYPVDIRYGQGAVFESPCDLLKLNGSLKDGFRPKFELVQQHQLTDPNGAPLPTQPYRPRTAAERLAATKLDDLNLRQLKEIAAEEEIDLKGSNDKAEILRTLKALAAAAKPE